MSILTDRQREQVSIAQALTRVHGIFNRNPPLKDSNGEVPGLQGVSWKDLHTLLTYADGKFNQEPN